MQAPVLFPIALTVQEIEFTNSINQAALSKKGRETLVKGLLHHCYLFFDLAHQDAMSKVGVNNSGCRRITYSQNRSWHTFYYNLSEIQKALFHHSNEQKFKQLTMNSDTQTCMMHCTYLLAQALIDGHNEGIATRRHNRNIVGLKPETFVLHLLAEIDSDFISLNRLATTKVIQSLWMSFFLKNRLFQPLQKNNVTSIFNSKWIWTTQFQGELILEKINKSKAEFQINTPDDEDEEESKFLAYASNAVTAILSRPTVPLYPSFWPCTPHK